MRTILAFALALVCTLPVIAREDASGALLQIVFQKGHDFANFDDAIPAGQTRGYSLHVRKGQTIKMKVVAPENGVVFSLYAPGAAVWREDYKSPMVVEGTALVSRHTANDIWTIAAPSTGDYVILFEQAHDASSASFGGAVIVR